MSESTHKLISNIRSIQSKVYEFLEILLEHPDSKLDLKMKEYAKKLKELNDEYLNR